MALSKIQSESIDLADNFAGMRFGGTASDNALEDYEEGTWTPVVRGGTTAGTGTYSAQTGTYIKVGKQVTLNFDYEISAHTGSGPLEISGLPFASSSTSGYETTGSCMATSFDFTNTPVNVSLYVGNNRTYLNIYITRDDGGWSRQDMDVAHALIGGITYISG